MYYVLVPTTPQMPSVRGVVVLTIVPAVLAATLPASLRNAPEKFLAQGEHVS